MKSLYDTSLSIAQTRSMCQVQLIYFWSVQKFRNRRCVLHRQMTGRRSNLTTIATHSVDEHHTRDVAGAVDTTGCSHSLPSAERHRAFVPFNQASNQDFTSNQTSLSENSPLAHSPLIHYHLLDWFRWGPINNPGSLAVQSGTVVNKPTAPIRGGGRIWPPH